MAILRRKNRREVFIRGLQHDYQQELVFARQMKQSARQSRYQQYRDKLLAIAAGEEKHAATIKEMLARLDSSVPEEIPPETPNGRSLFETLNEALRKDHDSYYDRYRLLFEAEEEGLTDLIPLLDEMRDREAEHRQILLSILLKMNSYQI